MSRKNKDLPVIENLEVLDLALEGNAIARFENQIVFIPMAIPGDIVTVKVIRKKKNYLEAKIIEVTTKSPLRQDPWCKHFGICGGCKWQHLPYEEQLKWKQKHVLDNMERIGKVSPSDVFPIMASPEIQYYRNKLEFTFSHKRWLELIDLKSGVEAFPGAGFHIPGMFDKVLDIDECYHQPEPSNKIRNHLKHIAKQNNIPFYNIREKSGFLRTLIIRNSNLNHWMVILVIAFEDENWRKLLLNSLVEAFPEISSLYYVINSKGNDTIHDLDMFLYKGDEVIYEQMGDIKFKIGPKSFFQTNSKQAHRLYQRVLEMASLKKNEIVYDLYTGTGTIALFVASQVKKVIGVEYVKEAIDDAIANADYNQIENVVFFAGDMKDVLNDAFIVKNGQPDVIILDPPRAGVHSDVLEVIKRAAPNRIVYVSCNSATQARDLAVLCELYRLESIQAVDMFPHTHHIENIALLCKNS